MMSEQTVENPRPRSLVPIAVMGTVLGAIVIVGLFALSGVRAVVGAVPTAQDVAEVVEPEPYQKIGPVIVSSIQDMASLTTVESVEYTIVEKGTDKGWLQWARGDSLRLLAVARIGAGVDLSGLGTDDFTVTEDGLVRVTVPHAEIQYVSVDNDATQILDRDKGVFTKGDDRLETEARQLAETVLVQTAREQGITEKAEASAEKVLTNFITGLGYRKVEVHFSAV